MNKNIHTIKTIMIGAMALLGVCSCSEETPNAFEEINGVYFNNRSNTNVLMDSTNLTFVYNKGDEMQVPVKIQLVGRPSDHVRTISLTVTSDDAIEGVDYILPEKAEMPAGETSYEYIVTLKRTAALKASEKHLQFSLQPNDNFQLPVTQEKTANGDVVTTLSYKIAFSDMFTTAPKAWDKGLLGEFSYQKFVLACRVLDLNPADFNDDSKMTLAMQSYISVEMQAYVKEQEKLRNSGKPYDADAFDAKGLPLQFYKTKG